jgi:hypothetical protein
VDMGCGTLITGCCAAPSQTFHPRTLDVFQDAWKRLIQDRLAALG